MSLLMKALKQAERDHEKANQNEFDAPARATANDDATLIRAASEPVADDAQEVFASTGIELLTQGEIEQGDLVQASPVARDVEPDSTLEFEQRDNEHPFEPIHEPQELNPDLTRHRQDAEPSQSDFTSTDSTEQVPTAESPVDSMAFSSAPATEPQLDPVSGESPESSLAFSDAPAIAAQAEPTPEDSGLDARSRSAYDAEQELIDSANEGALLGSAQLATPKKRPSAWRKIALGLLVGLVVVAGIAWYAIQILHIPSPVPGPRIGQEPYNVSRITTTGNATGASNANAAGVANSSSPKDEKSALVNADQDKPSSSKDRVNGQSESATPQSKGAPSSQATSKPRSSARQRSQSARGSARPTSRLQPPPVSSADAGKPNLAKPPVRFLKVASAGERQATLLNEAYAALRANDDVKADQLYREALANDSLSADVWIGLATLATRAGDIAQARQAYENALHINPNDSVALAGQLSLQSEADALSQESRYRNLLAADPNNAALQFALASSLAAQERWVEAQQAYFNAAAAEPDHPDYAFNLAVSLEHIRQPAVALQYYTRALELSAKRQPKFDRAIAKRRSEALRSKPGRS